ncbi:hypothetical protein ATSB10_25690 [Dyella thiooxydans]|uniref:Uncharacterized protein n=1 Tax=Dyella thiooxydans TaxID=445710 RepID=A0A160N2A3_9GAMM|nr:hypothetical protein [Dyella thiooxydans]AND70023.1 hypothetical protein ATSB10_25690 [Dyella thiooxydans]
MKLLRDSLRWRALRPQLFGMRHRAERRYTVTVPAPRTASVRVAERVVATSSAMSGLR